MAFYYDSLFLAIRLVMWLFSPSLSIKIHRKTKVNRTSLLFVYRDNCFLAPSFMFSQVPISVSYFQTAGSFISNNWSKQAKMPSLSRILNSLPLGMKLSLNLQRTRNGDKNAALFNSSANLEPVCLYIFCQDCGLFISVKIPH